MSNYIPPKREDFDTEEDYQYAIEHYWDLYNMAEDMAMEEHYEKRNGGRNGNMQ